MIQPCHVVILLWSLHFRLLLLTWLSPWCFRRVRLPFVFACWYRWHHCFLHECQLLRRFLFLLLLSVPILSCASLMSPRSSAAVPSVSLTVLAAAVTKWESVAAVPSSSFCFGGCRGPFSFFCFGGCCCFRFTCCGICGFPHDAFVRSFLLLVSHAVFNNVIDSSLRVCCCGPFIFFCFGSCDASVVLSLSGMSSTWDVLHAWFFEANILCS